MNCKRCQTELEDFLYGELSERLAGQMRAHLADCSECTALRDELEREHELFTQFYEQTAIDPTGEMWDAIRARIAEEPVRQATETKPRWWQSLAGGWLTPVLMRQAALALLLIALSVTATIVLMRRGDDGKNIARHGDKQNATSSPQPPVPSPTTNVAQVTPETAITPPVKQENVRREVVKPHPLSDQELLVRQLARAEREYQGAIRMLDQAITKRREDIAPDAFKQYQASLALIVSFCWRPTPRRWS
jgi:anti-sigma factor RsiW